MKSYKSCMLWLHTINVSRMFFLYYHLIKRYYFSYWRINTEIEQNVDIYGLCCKKKTLLITLRRQCTVHMHLTLYNQYLKNITLPIMCVIIFINLKRNIIYITCISVLSRHVATFLKVEGGGQTYPKNDKKTSKKINKIKNKNRNKTKTTITKTLKKTSAILKILMEVGRGGCTWTFNYFHCHSNVNFVIFICSLKWGGGMITQS